MEKKMISLITVSVLGTSLLFTSVANASQSNSDLLKTENFEASQVENIPVEAQEVLNSFVQNKKSVDINKNSIIKDGPMMASGIGYSHYF